MLVLLPAPPAARGDEASDDAHLQPIDSDLGAIQAFQNAWGYAGVASALLAETTRQHAAMTEAEQQGCCLF